MGADGAHCHPFLYTSYLEFQDEQQSTAQKVDGAIPTHSYGRCGAYLNEPVDCEELGSTQHDQRIQKDARHRHHGAADSISQDLERELETPTSDSDLPDLEFLPGGAAR